MNFRSGLGLLLVVIVVLIVLAYCGHFHGSLSA